MNLELLFLVSTVSVIPLWLLLVLAPDSRLARRAVHTAIPFLVLAALYVVAQALEGEPPPGAGFASLEAVRILFSTDSAMLGVWLHFLALDLFAGAWIARDAAAEGIRHRWVAPLLLVTFALAPLGLGLYLLVRSVRQRGPGLASSR